jgi:hypothetical protein
MMWASSTEPESKTTIAHNLRKHVAAVNDIRARAHIVVQRQRDHADEFGSRAGIYR